MKYTTHVSLKQTEQTSPVLGKKMVENNAGGFVFQIDEWKQLDRFLILGTEGGSYYTGEKALTVENAENVIKCIKLNGRKTVERIVDISFSGRAPKNKPALFALSLCMSPALADISTRQLACEAVPKVARTSTDFFAFINMMQHSRGWGKLAKLMAQNWYQLKTPSELEYQLVKYRQRGAWCHSDVLRLAKPKPISPLHNQLYSFAKHGYLDDNKDFKLIEGFDKIQKAETAKEAAKLITEYKLPMETVPTRFKKELIIWDALLPHLPMTALIRNLRNIAKSGLLVPLSETSKFVSERLTNQEAIIKARVHPIQFLNALMAYGEGKARVFENGYVYGAKKDPGTWLVSPNVMSALNQGFHLAFKTVKPTGKSMMLALDVSGSMNWQSCLGIDNLTPREASAALALVTLNVEDNCMIGVFTDKFTPFNGITKGMSVQNAIKAVSNLKFGTTNISAPIEWSIKNNIKCDIFSIFTDNETYQGKIHPYQALKLHRNKFSIPTKLITVAMTSTGFSIADPSDPLMMDLIGFDSSSPSIISEFSML